MKKIIKILSSIIIKIIGGIIVSIPIVILINCMNISEISFYQSLIWTLRLILSAEIVNILIKYVKFLELIDFYMKDIDERL